MFQTYINPLLLRSFCPESSDSFPLQINWARSLEGTWNAGSVSWSCDLCDQLHRDPFSVLMLYHLIIPNNVECRSLSEDLRLIKCFRRWAPIPHNKPHLETNPYQNTDSQCVCLNAWGRKKINFSFHNGSTCVLKCQIDCSVNRLLKDCSVNNPS